MAEKSDQLLTQKDVMAITGLKANTLEQWRMMGKGPKFLKLGGAVRYRRRDIDSWLDSCDQCKKNRV